jgi:hypothetical protein
MPLLVLLTLLALILIQSLEADGDQYQPALRAAVLWGGLIVASTELLSLAKAVDFIHLTIFWAACLMLSLGWLAWQLRRGKHLPRLRLPAF